jgi:hypothetical protein
MSQHKTQRNKVEWPDACRRGFRGNRRLHSLSAIVSNYAKHHGQKAKRELRYLRAIPTFEDAVTQAGLALRPERDSKKRSSHQRRISRAVLEQATRRLRRAKLKSAASFDDLIKRVRMATKVVDGIGELYVYDTSLRIGAWLRLLPRKVYLHAGTRLGAQALHLDHHAKSLAPKDLPSTLRRLRPYEIEDVLCIYKEWLGKAKYVGRPNRRKTALRSSKGVHSGPRL